MAAAAPDKISAAIAASAADPQPGFQITMRGFQITLHTGRQVLLQVPADATDDEMRELLVTVTTQLWTALISDRADAHKSRILVPR
jgi:hypothetical protein